MRTTLSLSEDLYKAIKNLCAEKSISYKELVDQLLRLGLKNLHQSSTSSPEDYYIEPVSLGMPTMQIDNIAEVLAITEGDSHP